MGNLQQNIFGKKRPQVRNWKNITKLLLCLSLISCKSEPAINEIDGVIFQGETQGTTYQIILAEEKANFSNEEIKVLLKQFDSVLSTYVDTSLISRINNSTDKIVLKDSTHFFKECYEESALIFKLTNGAFDPSVFPLVEGWGFLKNLETPLSQTKVDSILKFVSMENGKFHSVSFNGDEILFSKKDSRFKLDFNAIAQGMAVDKLAEFIQSRGHRNFYVEIGGEIIVKGKNRSGVKWNIGIDVPKDSEIEKDDGIRSLESVLSITDKAIATSGNYRKFYIKDGKKYAHTLDPKKGFPVQHSMLSATVVSDKCSTSDAFATAFMVMGLEKSKQFIQNNPDLKLDVLLLYDLGNEKIGRYKSQGMNKFFTE